MNLSVEQVEMLLQAGILLVLITLTIVGFWKIVAKLLKTLDK